MSNNIKDIVTAIDNATNVIAAALDAEGGVISTLASEIAALRTQQGVPPDVLTALGSIQTRLAAVSTAISTQTTQLEAIGADPANPVPDATT